MANRFPLIVDSSALQIKELPASDNLDLTNSSIVNVVDITASGNVSVGGVLTYEDVTNIDSVGIVTAQQGIKVLAGGINAVGVITATSFVGSGADLTALNASNLASGTIPDARFPSTLPAINGSQLTGVISGVETKEGGTSKGTSQVSLNFVGATVAAAGDETTVTIGSAGLSTEAFVSSGIVTAVRLSTAQDHKITASGITTITTSGEGTEGESHTIRIINSGITTVGFSTYFLFPSGSTPSLPTADGAISLISFTVNRVGAAGTQLLAGASLNFS
jgi:hypothetical protein